MISVIIVGRQAIEVARRLKVAGFTPDGYGPWDLGPDYGEDTARVLLTAPTDNEEALRFLENSRKAGWLPPLDWRMVPDGGKYRLGGDVAVEGTPI